MKWLKCFKVEVKEMELQSIVRHRVDCNKRPSTFQYLDVDNYREKRDGLKALQDRLMFSFFHKWWLKRSQGRWPRDTFNMTCYIYKKKLKENRFLVKYQA